MIKAIHQVMKIVLKELSKSAKLFVNFKTLTIQLKTLWSIFTIDVIILKSWEKLRLTMMILWNRSCINFIKHGINVFWSKVTNWVLNRKIVLGKGFYKEWSTKLQIWKHLRKLRGWRSINNFPKIRKEIQKSNSKNLKVIKERKVVQENNWKEVFRRLL
jgi:hypothetical protein